MKSKLCSVLSLLHQCLMTYVLSTLLAVFFCTAEGTGSMTLPIPALTALAMVPACIVSYLLAEHAKNFAVFLVGHAILIAGLWFLLHNIAGYSAIAFTVLLMIAHTVEGIRQDKDPLPFLSPNVGYVLVYLIVYLFNRYGLHNTVLGAANLYCAAADVLIFCMFNYQNRLDSMIANEKQGSTGFDFPEGQIRRNGRILILIFLVITLGLMILVPLNGINALTGFMQSGLIALLTAVFALLPNHVNDTGYQPAEAAVEEETAAETFEKVAVNSYEVPQWVNLTIYIILTILAIAIIAAVVWGLVYALILLLRGFHGAGLVEEENADYTETVQSLKSEEKVSRNREETRTPTAVVRKLYRHIIRGHRKKHTTIPGSVTPNEAETIVGIEEGPDRSQMHDIYEKARYSREGADFNDSETMRSLARKKL